jgi:hypothetical protein
MVIEVKYQTPEDAADPHAKVTRTEFFESSGMPDKDTIVKTLIRMGKKFAEQTISISENDAKDAEALRKSGLRVTKI